MDKKFEKKLLDVKDLNVSFKLDHGSVLAVNGVSLSLDEGKVLGIIGESGSGKSVTAYSIMQILDKNGHIDSGKVLYNGTDLVKISEEEMRDIRGNKISIIFQDAMVSLNPVWSIGNQLAEAILTHAKNPIKTATYNLENEVRSDRQRIISMEKGLINHPEREELRKDLNFVKNVKLPEDLKALEDATTKAKNDYANLKHQMKVEYRAKCPEFNHKINKALGEYISKFFKLAPKPEVNDATKSKKYIELDNEINSLEKDLVQLHKDYDFFIKNAEKNDSYDIEKKERESGFKQLEQRIEKLKVKKNKYIKYYIYNVVHAPRKTRWQAVKDAYKAKYEYYWDCKSAYKETMYSALKKSLKMLEEVGITDAPRRMKQYPFEMSGGMLQRAMIAMALVQRPDILIADEPTTALDVTIQAQILELLKKMQAEYGMAIIIITHDLGVIAQICDEVDIMYAGRIVERGTVDDIFYRPQHEYTKGLLNSMPKLDSPKGKLESISGNPVDLFCLPKGCAFSSRCKECMKICIEKYPEEVVVSKDGHATSCWKVIEAMHKAGKIDIEHGEPEGKPLHYNGAFRRN